MSGTVGPSGISSTKGYLGNIGSKAAAPKFETYASNANSTGDAEKGTAGDVVPEGLKLIAADKSPTGKAILVEANEVSGSMTAVELK